MNNSAFRILVVEDERLVAEDLVYCLNDLGHEVVGLTGSGEEAVNLAQETRPDIVLMDICLKGDTDGIEAAGLISAKIHAPVLFLTAYSGTTLLERAKKTNPCGYLLKPFTRKDLRVALEMAFYKAQIENRLMESEERYRTLVELSPAGIMLHVHGKIVLANQEAANILGAHSAEKLMGKDLIDFVHPEFVDITLERQQMMCDDDEFAPLLEEIFVRLDGKQVHVEVASGFLTYGGQKAVQTLIRDITDRKKAESERERLIAKLRATEEALRFQATHDDLTGVLNRRAILERLKAEMARTLREGGSIALIMLDIDNFKNINDRFGHQVGDSALCEVANRIMDSIRPYDSAGRYGGEEFLVVVPGADLESACAVADRLRRKFENEPIPIGKNAFPMTVSLGVSSSRNLRPKDVDTFIQAADQALYAAKRSGRNRVEFSGVMNQMMQA